MPSPLGAGRSVKFVIRDVRLAVVMPDPDQANNVTYFPYAVVDGNNDKKHSTKAAPNKQLLCAERAWLLLFYLFLLVHSLWL